MTSPDTPLRDRFTTAPRPYDPERAVWLTDALAAGPMAEALTHPATRAVIAGVGGCSPYLSRLIRHEAAWLQNALQIAPHAALNAALDAAAAATHLAPNMDAAMAVLRQAKARGALLIALADVGGVWTLEEVTGALTDLADATLIAAARWLLAREIARGKLPLNPEDPALGSGYALIAMGKHGARELNYSSDIDIVAFFDPDIWPDRDYAHVKDRFNRGTRDLVKMMQQPTAEGYVFRTDLRLRPDPGATPPCMDMDSAERYYEGLGKNWERAAYIKARPAAGDLAAGADFLNRLNPFVWRKYLDFAAIEDVQNMKTLIHAHKGHAKIKVQGHDLKLGRGGIREIEFYAQTQQLIAGGRDKTLRQPTTVGALAALTQAGKIDAKARDEMAEDYRLFRTVEHRIQMIDDAQTHQIPDSPEGVARLAAFLGYPDTDTLSADLRPRMTRISERFQHLFQPETALAEQADVPISLFGPDDDPDAVAALADLGYADPDAALSIVRGWGLGRVPATRTDRARAKLNRLAPLIAQGCAAASSPDGALAEFNRFISGLPAGVQLFSLLESNPALLDLLAEIFAAAPRMSAYLARNSAVIDAVLAEDFFQPLPPADALAADFARLAPPEDDIDSALDVARRWAKERIFQQSVQVLRGLSDPAAAGRGYSDVAETAMRGLAPYASAYFARRHGPPPGDGAIVLAMGRLGSGEMTAGSDLDLIVLYESAGAAASDGPKPLSPTQYYARWTQKFITTLTVPTSEGMAYEVDMRLRPSGRAGPLATALDAFDRYQREDAWTWEHMALTRARVVAGSPDLAARAQALLVEILTEVGAQGRADGRIRRDAADMRHRLDEAHGADVSNPWSLKHAHGGLVDIEFIAQTGLLEAGLAGRVSGATIDALTALAKAGALNQSDAAALQEAYRLQAALLHLERAALTRPFSPQEDAATLKAHMAAAAQSPNFDAAETRLRAMQAEARRVFDAWFLDM